MRDTARLERGEERSLSGRGGPCQGRMDETPLIRLGGQGGGPAQVGLWLQHHEELRRTAGRGLEYPGVYFTLPERRWEGIVGPYRQAREQGQARGRQDGNSAIIVEHHITLQRPSVISGKHHRGSQL